MSKKRFYVLITIIYLIFIGILTHSGYFKIGLLSDDYNNLNDAVNTSIQQKITAKLPYTNTLHLRPIYYLSIQFGYFLHNSLGLEYDNFINFRVGNLILFIILSYLCGGLVYLLTQNYFSSIMTICSIIIFPSNIHNVCWTAGRVDILCGIFYILYIYFTFLFTKEKRKSFLIFSCIALIASLLSKETAITALPTCIIFVYFFKGKDIVKVNFKLFLFQVLILISYFIYRYALDIMKLPPNSEEKGGVVLIKSFLTLVLPVDFLTIQFQLKNNDLSMLLYFTIFITFAFLFILYSFQNDFFRNSIYTIVICAITVLPYSLTGYVRPQIILIPFSIAVIFIISVIISGNKTHSNLFKPLIFSYIFVLISWFYFSISSVHQWLFSYDYSKKILNNLIETNVDHKKYTIILGNPGRISQSFMFDKLTGAYNYWKYRKPVVNDILYDIVLLGTFGQESIGSEVKYVEKSENECEITIFSENQYFYIEGIKLDETNRSFENDKIKIYFSGFSYTNKPSKMDVFFKTKEIACLLFNGTKYSRIK